MEDQCVFANAQVTGYFEVEYVAGKSTAVQSFSRYPLKLIVPNKIAPSSDVVWVYALSYGGGIVSGDSIYIKMKVGSCCTCAFTTQASTKIYKSIDGRLSRQLLQHEFLPMGLESYDALYSGRCHLQPMRVSIESGGSLIMLPDPVTCFSAAKYEQFQTFYLDVNASLVLVDWCTSGRRERGEIWDFDYYRSTNHVMLAGKPLFLDSMCLENEAESTISSRMRPFHVIAMVTLYGPKVQSLCKELQNSIQQINHRELRSKSKSKLAAGKARNSNFVVSCSTFGPKENGLVVRVVAEATEPVYDFLRHHLASLSSLVGVMPYVGK